jgi:3-hydroxybutyrate dehydrogenase
VPPLVFELAQNGATKKSSGFIEKHNAMTLKGKTAVITGSTSGIGLGIARLFAETGVNIMLNGFGDPDEIRHLENSLKACDVDVAYHGADLSLPDAIGTLIREAEMHFGAIDILVNNAGIQHVAPVDVFPTERWDRIISINLSAAFHTIRMSLPAMRRQKWGRIVNIASAHSLVASPYKSAYVAAKHGLLGLTRCVALETAEEGITCNAVCPGYVLTPLVEQQVEDTAKARGISRESVKRDVMLAAQWTKRFVAIEEVAQTALFLCSDAATNITGAALSIDGGWTAA